MPAINSAMFSTNHTSSSLKSRGCRLKTPIAPNRWWPVKIGTHSALTTPASHSNSSENRFSVARLGLMVALAVSRLYP
jgi:hypothetical protein